MQIVCLKINFLPWKQYDQGAYCFACMLNIVPRMHLNISSRHNKQTTFSGETIGWIDKS